MLNPPIAFLSVLNTRTDTGLVRPKTPSKTSDKTSGETSSKTCSKLSSEALGFPQNFTANPRQRYHRCREKNAFKNKILVVFFERPRALPVRAAGRAADVGAFVSSDTSPRSRSWPDDPWEFSCVELVPCFIGSPEVVYRFGFRLSLCTTLREGAGGSAGGGEYDALGKASGEESFEVSSRRQQPRRGRPGMLYSLRRATR